MNMAAILFLFIFILLQLFTHNRDDEVENDDQRGTMIMRSPGVLSLGRKPADMSEIPGPRPRKPVARSLLAQCIVFERPNKNQKRFDDIVSGNSWPAVKSGLENGINSRNSEN
jgi:hypothetical protein